jgi:hypothetical protein
VANVTARVDRVPRCRACRLPGADGRRLIAGPGIYLCEACIALLPTQESATSTAKRCSFCGRRDVAIAGAWPSFAICVPCADVARGVLAEDDGRARPAT